MSAPLWDKGQTADIRMQSFLCGDDLVWDAFLLPFDIQASIAHVDGLVDIGLLPAAEGAQLNTSLTALETAVADGEFVLAAPFEDGHSAIEAWLVQMCGDVGKKVHTGRSRNDQVQVAMRLYLRDRLQSLTRICREIGRSALNGARQHQQTPLPGYTHMQRAVPSSLGLWFASWAEGFADIAALAEQTAKWLNTSPLGSAAGYGVNLPLNRAATAKRLGFDRVQTNPAYCQNSRGRFELQALMALSQATLELRRLCWDLSLFVTSEFSFARLPDRLTTGSSIMPNKRNPDLIELLRATHGVVSGAMAEIESILSIPSGYQRDLQGTKGPCLRAFERALMALELVPDLLNSLSFDEARMRDAIDDELYMTDIAVDAARDGVPFRDAYRQAAGGQSASRSPERSLSDRISPGGCGDLQLDQIEEKLCLKN